MKTKLILLILSTAPAMFAAIMSIEVPDADVPRILEAYGSIYNLKRNATPAEVQTMIQGWLQTSTLDYERRKNIVQFTPPPMNFSPTPTATPGLAAAAAKAPAPKPTATPKTKK
jgi:hypothetical protein